MAPPPYPLRAAPRPRLEPRPHKRPRCRPPESADVSKESNACSCPLLRLPPRAASRTRDASTGKNAEAAAFWTSQLQRREMGASREGIVKARSGGFAGERCEE